MCLESIYIVVGVLLFPRRLQVTPVFFGVVDYLIEFFLSCLFTGMTVRLWKYVSTFSHLSGERLHQIYSKLKKEQEEAGVGPSHVNGSASVSFGRNGNPVHHHMERQRGLKNMTSYQLPESVSSNTGKSEAWKRRRRAESEDHFQVPPQRSTSSGVQITDPNSLGILGAGPSDKRFVSEKPYRTQPGGVPLRQSFSSGIN